MLEPVIDKDGFLSLLEPTEVLESVSTHINFKTLLGGSVSLISCTSQGRGIILHFSECCLWDTILAVIEFWIVKIVISIIDRVQNMQVIIKEGLEVPHDCSTVGNSIESRVCDSNWSTPVMDTHQTVELIEEVIEFRVLFLKLLSRSDFTFISID